VIPRYLVDFDSSSLPCVETDVIVVGAGIAGLYTALEAGRLNRVILISKKSLFDSNTRYAQGGIAAVISDEDSFEFHRQDTLIAGAGLCEPDAVDVLVREGPDGVRSLIRYGTHFDEVDGHFALTREGAHSQRRILHAKGDATGFEIVRALAEKVQTHPNVRIWNDHFAIDLIMAANGECAGVLVQRPDDSRVIVRGKAVVLCTGGGGQMYRYTTNPEIATGDGVAMAYRAGAVIRDMEFFQFHPTALSYPGAPRFLISEAVRGEGAVLRNIHGERFMERYDPRLELAPRDIVARAILREMEQTGSTYVYIDITHESPEFIRQRFPSIYEYCLRFGLDMTTDWIPVAPAAHYMMGGVKTDLYGETNIPRLFACGETSSTGVHGANRLASNSLSEAIVFGRRIAERIGRLPPPSGDVRAVSAEGRHPAYGQNCGTPPETAKGDGALRGVAPGPDGPEESPGRAEPPFARFPASAPETGRAGVCQSAHVRPAYRAKRPFPGGKPGRPLSYGFSREGRPALAEAYDHPSGTGHRRGGGRRCPGNGLRKTPPGCGRVRRRKRCAGRSANGWKKTSVRAT